MINQTPSKTYTFLHAFKDGTYGICSINPLPKGWIPECLGFHVQVPMDKGKRWRNEFERWMGEVIIPFQLTAPFYVEAEFRFVQQ